MANLYLHDIPEGVFAELQTLARRSEMSVEDYTMGIICDEVAKSWHGGEGNITIKQLQANLEAILRVAEQEPVFVLSESGKRYVILSTDEFARLN
ncbi:hypothetical protein [uncultured Roseobacter sp.]|uniref:hypothetical protein n=1 Tax=uncultured Roseobacter sp. TaxID=114847 RepID=UPI00262EDB76|nr:hypothetical protein [uncultured Roseobacter sp.]